jgi:hypothetical protein
MTYMQFQNFSSLNANIESFKLKELMEFTNATRQASRLEDGSHKIDLYAQWNNYFFKSTFVLVPHMLEPSIFSKVVNQLHAFKVTKSTPSTSYLPNPNAPPYYNVISTTTPQHCLVLDSNTLTPFDFHESPLQYSFGPEPSQSA